MAGPIDPQNSNAVGLDFIRTEIETGLTFASLAAAAGDDTDKRERNRANAQTALSAVRKFLPRLTLTSDERIEIDGGIAQLTGAIDSIGT
jgi:hypothetical protein